VSGGHQPPRVPLLTTERRFGAGPVARAGGLAPYRTVEIVDGERHQVREELLAGAPGRSAASERPLLCLVHVTDLQLADVHSPTRFEFLNRYFADPRYAEIIPVQRPQEVLTAHAIDATIRTLNTLTGPAAGARPQLAVTTGDAIDNAQWNELQAFLTLFDGGLVTFSGGHLGHQARDSAGTTAGRVPPVTPGRANGRYEGVQSLQWPDDIFWKPDGHGPDGPDIFQREFGFPLHPGLLERALRDFNAAGLAIGWLSCFGNHEALNQGVGVQTDGLAAALTGGVKPVTLPDGFDHDRALELFIEQPEIFMTGPLRPVTPEPGRRPITRGEFVAAHFRPGARPAGHGFTEQNRHDGTAYYVHDTPAVRMIALDTTCLAGGADGCLDADQARWLEERLTEVHSVVRTPGGDEIRTGNDDRLVIVFSHHGVDTLTNLRAHSGPDGVPLLGGAKLVALLHRFDNVVLWLNGHTHTNAVQPRPDPVRPGRGFWEVTTCAVIDWPCQTRLVELIDSGGHVKIVCTMIDHDTPAAATSLSTTDDLASLHRELAANMPFMGADSGRAGETADRNVVLRLAAPFPLHRLRP
jgi:metallophosphoesterase (TIGR03767 family)